MPAAGRGQRWARAWGAGPRGLEVLMLLISIDFPSSSAYRWLRLGRPEGQLSSAGAAGKMLGQQVLPAPPPAHGKGPLSWAVGEGWSEDGGTGTPTAPTTLHLGGEAMRGSPTAVAHVPVSGLGSALEPQGWLGWGHGRNEQRGGAGIQLLRGGMGCGGALGAPCMVLDASEMLHRGGAPLQAAGRGGGAGSSSSTAPEGSALTVKTALRLLSISMSWGTPVLAQRIT